MSGHPIEIRRLASSAGLLHPQPSKRTKLAEALRIYPLEQPSDEADDLANHAAAEVALASLLKGPLRPESQRGGSMRRKPKKADDASSSSSGPHAPSSPSSQYSVTDPYASVGYSSHGTLQSRSNMSAMSGWSGLTSLTSASGTAAATRVRTPHECPVLPAAFLPRRDLLNQLQPRLQAETATVGFSGATVCFGMGGAGKTMLAASLMRHQPVYEGYDRLCWVTLGATPDLRRLLAMLCGQLLQQAPADGDYGDVLTLQQSVVRAARGLTVLCVLDDVWDPAHARVLGQPLDSAVLLVTTRIHHLIPGAYHAHQPSSALINPHQPSSTLTRPHSI